MDNQPSNNPKQALIDKIKESTNILVTVSSNPSVDQLAACLGLTLWLNKIEKHATAVFSGDVPSTLDFLQPAETLEKTTDSLRDFIIALDKSKADKLRYKVEENVVKIFITPYRTSLTADDLEFTQGDFNVDMVIALGVSAQADLDTAITSHGRILHDAIVATITTGDSPSELGSVSWHDAQASSLSELVVELGNDLDRTKLDGQTATALLTGVVAETERFSNEKTTPQTMSISAELMSAGANQQLVASKLDEPVIEPEPEAPVEPEVEETPEEPEEQKKSSEDGTLEIEHDPSEVQEPKPAPEAEPEPEAPVEPEVEETPQEPAVEEAAAEDEGADESAANSRIMTEPPALGGTLTANSRPEDSFLEPSSDPLSQVTAEDTPLLDHEDSKTDDAEPESSVEPEAPLSEVQPPVTDVNDMQPAPPDWMPPQPWMDQPTATSAAEPTPDNPEPEISLPEPTLPADEPVEAPVEPEAVEPVQEPAPFTPPSGETLAELEAEVGAHAADAPVPAPDDVVGQEAADLDAARDEVMKAINGVPDANPEPVQALNAQPIDLEQPAEMPAPPAAPAYPEGNSTSFDPAAFEVINDRELVQQQPAVDPDLTGAVNQPFSLPLPGSPVAAPSPVPPTSVSSVPAPPPVPPPLPPPGFPPAQ